MTSAIALETGNFLPIWVKNLLREGGNLLLSKNTKLNRQLNSFLLMIYLMFSTNKE